MPRAASLVLFLAACALDAGDAATADVDAVLQRLRDVSGRARHRKQQLAPAVHTLDAHAAPLPLGVAATAPALGPAAPPEPIGECCVRRRLGALPYCRCNPALVTDDVLPPLGRWGGGHRLELGPNDRVGFVRFRKVGSTLVHNHLEKRLNMCVSRCASHKLRCADCLYGAGACGECRDSSSVRRYTHERCYPCSHFEPDWLIKQFRTSSPAAGRARSLLAMGGRLHLVAVVRDPFERILSEFFFIRPVCDRNRSRTTAEDAEGAEPEDGVLAAWFDGMPAASRAAVCAGDLLAFATGEANPVVNQQTRQMAGLKLGYGSQFPELEPATDEAGFSALHRLRTEFALVLVQERLVPDGLALLDFVFGRSTMARAAAELDPAALLAMEAGAKRDAGREGGRVGARSALRAELESNATLAGLVRAHNRHDAALHQAAQALFADSMALMTRA